MDLTEFKENVTAWGESRGIYAGSTWQKQLEKWGEERAEMLYAETTEELIDAIGDQAVCLVHCWNMCNKKIPSPFLVEFWTAGEEATSGVEWCVIKRDFRSAISCLEDTAEDLGLNFGDCLSMSWSDIKDRRGLMIDGKFVKWDNLNDDQKAECEARGQ